jgi:hypothetical protein
MALQADGKIIIGGAFTTINGTQVNRLARLNADGTLDLTFFAGGGGVSSNVLGVNLLPDGKVLCSGGFTTVNGAARTGIARLTNNNATESLTVTRDDPRVIRWTRGGASPEVSAVTFERVGGNNEGFLGYGKRDATTGAWYFDGWIPSAGTLLARGRVTGGYLNGGGGLVEATLDYTFILPMVETWEAKPTLKTARAHAKVTGRYAATTAVFEYSQDPAMASGVMLSVETSVPKSQVRQNVYSTLEGLSPHTTYYYRIRGTNYAGTAIGKTGHFTTGNSQPVASLGTANATTGDPISIALPVSDADGDAPWVDTVLPDSHLTIDRIDGTTVTITPAAGYVGTATFTYSVSDGFASSETATMVVTITDNDAPVVSGLFSPLTLFVEQGWFKELPDYRPQFSASDNLNVASITQSPPAGASIYEGDTEVTLTARDAAGNAGVLRFHVQARVNGVSFLATKRDEVPGAGVDPRLPAGTTWLRFGVPSIVARGTRIGWMASARTPAGRVFHGIFAGPFNHLALRLRTGEPVPDENGDLLPRSSFAHFRDPVLAGEDFAVQATAQQPGSGRRTGIWIGQGDGPVKRIALEGTVAPGTESEFKAFTSLAMPAPGVVFFSARLEAPTWNDFGLWVWTAAEGTRRILGKGDLLTVDGHPLTIRSFQALTAVPGSPGHGHYAADTGILDVRLQLASPDRIVAIATVAPDGTVRLLQRSGKPGPMTNFVVSDLSISSSPGGEQRGAALMKFRAGTPYAPWIFDFETQRVIAARDFYAGGPATFANFGAPVCGLGSEGRRTTAFAARLRGVSASGNESLWAHTGELALVAYEGEEPPGAPGARWKHFTSLSVLEGRGPMFTATLDSRGDRPMHRPGAGLWATDSTGALKLIVRDGDRDRGPALRHFDVLQAVAGSPGQRRAWTAGDPSARIIYRAFFTDGTSSIVTTAVP